MIATRRHHRLRARAARLTGPPRTPRPETAREVSMPFGRASLGNKEDSLKDGRLVSDVSMPFGRASLGNAQSLYVRFVVGSVSMPFGRASLGNRPTASRGWRRSATRFLCPSGVCRWEMGNHRRMGCLCHVSMPFGRASLGNAWLILPSLACGDAVRCAGVRQRGRSAG